LKHEILTYTKTLSGSEFFIKGSHSHPLSTLSFSVNHASLQRLPDLDFLSNNKNNDMYIL
jgi:hypothetical protein